MIRKLLLMLFALVAVNGLFAQSGTIKGKVLDADNGEPIPFANVSIMQGAKIVTGGMTDFDGVYTIKPVPVGKFTVKVSYIGYKTIALNNVQVNNSKITFQDFKLPTSLSKIEEVVVKEYKVPLISKDQVSSGGTISQEDIGKMPGRSATAVAATVGGVSKDGSGNLNIRGARSEATVYYVDGVKVMGNSLPKSAIEQINVITGGMEARYGDATGGIVNITTRGASKEFAGGAEFVTSYLLDGYNYNLANITLMGPLYSKKEVDPYDSKKIKKTPVVGFLLTADAMYLKDQSPDIKGAWMAKDGIVDEINAAPYKLQRVPNNAIITNIADYYTSEDFENVHTKPNNSTRGINLNAKVTYNITPNMFVSVGGRINYRKSRLYSLSNSLFNSDKNGEGVYKNWQVSARFTHKLNNKTEEEEKKSASVLKNVYYQLVASYEKEGSSRYDRDFKDDLFSYGHVGKFETKKVPTYEWNTSLPEYPHGVWAMNGFADRGVTFTPSTYNKPLANYTNYYFSLFPKNSFYYLNQNIIEQYGGLYNGKFPEGVYSMFNLPGVPYNGYSKSDNTQISLSGNASADLKNHEISLGFQFEQRDERWHSVSPKSLWLRARQLANSHIQELDKENPIRHYVIDEDGNKIYSDTISYNRLFKADDLSMFAYKFREYLNKKGEMIDGKIVTTDGTQFIEVDSYSPEDLSIDYFSADELMNDGNSLVGYSGYDIYGNKMTDNVTVNDFFTEKNELGHFTRPKASFRPNYLAFYVQDKFSFDDLVFRIGVRADRYDANQEVLKDPYSLHNIYTVGELKEKGVLSNVPSNIGDDYYVYGDALNYEDNPQPKGYRIGDNPSNIRWYNAEGTLVEDPIKSIASANGMAPFLKSPDAKLSGDAFTDYSPKWNLMPRISFSFPVSDVSLFSAHYDVMTKRPVGANQMNPVQYLHLQAVAGNPISNPNLGPETTIEYELGFQQKVSNTSSLKIAAFYREMRDMAQVQNMTGAYPVNYMTYQNIDFGTVKGLTATYDLRRTGNIRMSLNYTLQFANATGSSANTAINLIKQNEPNLRTIFPTNEDTRHAINATIDYAYGAGKSYDGPASLKKILQNAGASFVVSYRTGNPYTRKDLVDEVLLGSVNGSRMPSTFNVNMRVYKNIPLKFGKKEASQFLQLYLDVANLFNTKNVRSVFQKTGNADDDAFLTNPKNLLTIANQISPAAYANYYRMMISMYGMYMGPRTIHLGLTYNF